MVITELPPDHAKKALEALCLPVVTPLQVGSSFNSNSIEDVYVPTYTLIQVVNF